MHVTNLPSSAFGLQFRRVDPAHHARPPSMRDSTATTAVESPSGDGPIGPVAAPDPARGSQLLRQLDHSALRDVEKRAPRPAPEVDHKRIHKALKRALKPMVRSLKKATRELMKEVGADKADRKAVRDLYKDFRTTIRATIKDARKSEIDNLVKIGSEVEEAFHTFVTGLKDVLGETPSRKDGRTEPAPPDSSVGDPSVSRTPDTKPPGTTIDRPLDTSDTTTDDTTSVPSRFDLLISKLESTFRGGMSVLMDTISSIMSDPLRHHHGHNDDHDRDDDRGHGRGHGRDHDHRHHRPHGDGAGVSGIDAFKGLISFGSGRRIDRAA